MSERNPINLTEARPPQAATSEMDLTPWGISKTSIYLESAKFSVGDFRFLPSTPIQDEEGERAPLLLLECLAYDSIVQSLVNDQQPPQDFTTFEQVPDVIRISNIPIDPAAPPTNWLLVCSKSAYLQKDGLEHEVGILCLVTPHRHMARWFYYFEGRGMDRLTHELIAGKLAWVHASYSPGDAQYTEYLQFFTESKTSAFAFPHARRYLEAQRIPDFCPELLDPNNALERIETYRPLQATLKRCGDVDRAGLNDRYRLSLHPVEVLFAGVTNVSCAEYMLLKRRFFQEFWRRLVDSGKAFLDVPPARINEDVLNAHDRHSHSRQNTAFPVSDQVAELQDLGLTGSRARYLTQAWEELGFCDDARVIERERSVDNFLFDGEKWLDATGNPGSALYEAKQRWKWVLK